MTLNTINNIKEKLNGEIPITRKELLVLVNSWGRNNSFYVKDCINNVLYIDRCKIESCCDLSKLDTSQITNMDKIFYYSNFNGDISQWNTSNVTSMNFMFCEAKEFNQTLNNWDTSNVTNMKRLFNGATIFNQDISNWDVSNVTNMDSMFFEAKAFNQNISNWDFTNIKECDYMLKNAEAFEEKYNNGESLPNYIDEVKRWFNFNRDKMDAIDIKNTHGKKIDDFFSKINNINSLNIKYK